MKHHIGQNIASLRKQRQITQAQLADFLFVTPQTVSKWESGNGCPDIAIIPKIAIFFNVTIDDLFGIAELEKIEDMVVRYSILRNEDSFQDALNSLECSIREKNMSETESSRMYALKAHLFLQKSRENISEAIDAIKQALSANSENGNIMYELQLYQLRLMNGEYKEVLSECQNALNENLTINTFIKYFEVLSLLENYDEIVELVETNKEYNAFFKKNKTVNMRMNYLYVNALIHTKEHSEADKYFAEVYEILDANLQVDLCITYLHLCQPAYENERIDNLKKKLSDSLAKADLPETIKEKIISRDIR